MNKRKESEQNITLWLEKDLVARIDKLAAKAEISRSRILRNLIEMSIDELEVVDKIGLFKFSIILQDLREGIRAWAEGLKMEPRQMGSKGR
jgi:Ribbon-helix-helix protein, copG family